MKLADRAHYGLAVSCAKRFQGRGVAMEELIAEAEAALLYAASRFDEERGVRFSTYAIPVVLGALKDLCRRHSPMHVPRSDLAIVLSVQEARERIRSREGAEPAVERLAQEVHIPPQRLAEILCAQERLKSASGALDASCAPEEGFEDRVLLRQTLRTLPAPYAQALWLDKGLGMSQCDIARRLGVGQPQVSRWVQKGIQLLRQALSDD